MSNKFFSTMYRHSDLWYSSMSSMDEAQLTTLRNLLRQRLLHWMFPLTVTWHVFLILGEYIDSLARMNPFTEGQSVHQLFEDGVYPLTVLFVLATSIGLQHRLLRRWPGFLRLPASAPLFATAFRLVVHGACLFVAVTVGAVLVFYLFYDPTKDPQGQFHIWVWAGGFLYAAALAPTATLFTVWRTTNRKHGNGMKGSEAS